jgi:hypothetical protein
MSSSRRTMALVLILSLAVLIALPASNLSATAAQNQKAPASTGIAHLHVYRPHRGMNSTFEPSVFVDNTQIIRITNGTHCTIKLTPGTHRIASDDKSSAITLTAKPGQDYYIRVDETTGFPKSRGKLTMMTPEQGAPEYKLQQPLDDKHRIVKDMIEENG